MCYNTDIKRIKREETATGAGQGQGRAGKTQMSKVRNLGKTTAETMEPIVRNLSAAAEWRHSTFEGHLWGCVGCGLVWDRKWHATNCEDRKHVARWEQRYGGITENGVHKGGRTYPRIARGRRRDIVAA